LRSILLGYFAAILFPIFYLGIPNPVTLVWYYRHGKTPVPPQLQRRAELANNLTPFVVMTAFCEELGVGPAGPPSQTIE